MKKVTMGYSLKNICPFISLGGSTCHHIYGARDKDNKNKIICNYSADQSRCPLYKLWEKQLDNDDKKKKCNTISKNMSRM